MSGSFERIDYTVRPAKYAERRMLRDIFRRVTPFTAPENYRYVGFGSVWFADFILFHRALGMSKMTSIESKASAKDRVRDNAPFSIDLVFERSGTALQKLNWNEYQFLWLDYDDAIDNEKLKDVALVAARAKSGTILAISLRSSESKEYASLGDAPGAAIKKFRETFAPSLYPDDVADDDLTGYPFSTLSRSMLTTKIEEALTVRSGTLADPIKFRTICSIDYADGVLMTTLVLIFFKESDASKVDACGFDKIDFIVDPSRPVRIEVPLLTPKEIRAIEAQLPLKAGEIINPGTSPMMHAERLAKLYRYFPNYMVAEI